MLSGDWKLGGLESMCEVGQDPPHLGGLQWPPPRQGEPPEGGKHSQVSSASLEKLRTERAERASAEAAEPLLLTVLHNGHTDLSLGPPDLVDHRPGSRQPE